MSGPHLVLVTPSFQAGGAERVIIHLANAAARSVRTTLVAVDAEGPFRVLVDTRVEVVGLGRSRARSAALPLVRLLRERRPDAVITSHTHMNILLGGMRPFIPRTTRTIGRQADLRGSIGRADRRVRLAQRTVYRGLDVVVATSAWMAEDIGRRHRGRIVTLPNPVDVSVLREQAAAVLPHERAGRRFILVGRLVAAKGVHDALEAFAEGSGPDDTLTIVGDGPEGEAMKARSRALGLGTQVQWVGFDPHPAPRVAASDALLMTSHSEGMPNVVLEALAVGTPVIATDDLVTLRDLATRVPDGALRFVPRRDLARAIAATSTGPASDVRPRPSLLPEEHLPDAVVSRLLEIVFEGAI
jgi:glycosyltransferase involved in cell wall biosynthesis